MTPATANVAGTCIAVACFERLDKVNCAARAMTQGAASAPTTVALVALKTWRARRPDRDDLALRGYLGASRIAPSRRMTSPFSISLVTIWCTSLA